MNPAASPRSTPLSTLLKPSRALAAAAFALACLALAGCKAAPRPQPPLVVPSLSEPWSPALRVAEDPAALGYTIMRDRLERWHLILGASGEGGASRMPHYVADRLGMPFRPIPPVESGSMPHASRMTAPYVVYKDPTLALLFYNHEDGVGAPGVRLLQSDTALMDGWAPLRHRGLQGGNLVLNEPGARDLCVLQDVRFGKFLMYYSGGPQNRRIFARESNNLLDWSEPRLVFTAAESDPAAEMPCVVVRQGLYYLFVSGLDYAEVSVYVSRDPFNFGQAGVDRLTTIPGHAARIIQDGSTAYIASAQIASAPGAGPRTADMQGVYLQKLNWTDAETALGTETLSLQQARLTPPKP